MDPVSAALSALALLVSVVSLGLSWRTASRQHQLGARQTDLQERLVELESARERDRVRETKSAALLASVVRQTENWTAVHVRPPRVDHSSESQTKVVLKPGTSLCCSMENLRCSTG